jgi:hypothetical protein
MSLFAVAMIAVVHNLMSLAGVSVVIVHQILAFLLQPYQLFELLLLLLRCPASHF